MTNENKHKDENILIENEDINEILDQDFNMAYTCKVEIDDILSQTDYFKKEDPKPSLFKRIFHKLTNRPYSYATIAVLGLILCSIGILIGRNINKNYNQLLNDNYNEYLTYYDVNIINQNSLSKQYDPKYINFDNELFNFYIFNGITEDNNLIYFIKYKSDNNINNILLEYESNKMYLSNNFLQILTIKENNMDEYEYFDLNFVIDNENYSYLIEIPKIE